MYVITKPFGKQGAYRTVYQSCRKRSDFGGPAFSFNKAAGNLSYCILFFFIINGQGKEVYPFPGSLGCGSGDQNNSVSVSDYRRSI
jgi:hypothetical protein